MNTFSHIMVGNIIRSYAKSVYGIEMKKGRFLYGNISPDFSPAYSKIPHYKKKAPHFIEEQIKSICNYPPQCIDDDKDEIAEKLGVICHYLSDYFCYAHSPRFEGNLYKHLRYETHLRKFNSKQRKTLRKIQFMNGQKVLTDPLSLIAQLDDLHEEYETSHISYDVDLYYTIKACIQLVVSIQYILRQRQAAYLKKSPLYTNKLSYNN